LCWEREAAIKVKERGRERPWSGDEGEGKGRVCVVKGVLGFPELLGSTPRSREKITKVAQAERELSESGFVGTHK